MRLRRFYEAKLSEVVALEQAGASALRPWEGRRASFRQALRQGRGGPLAVIAEYKKASPSRGIICEKLEPEDVALQYARSGASAISVLTEETYFHGHISSLHRMAQALDEERLRGGSVFPVGADVPLLRKDFLFHPLQVAATLSTPASALLLIVRLTPDAGVLRALREQAEAGGMEAVVEVFDEEDLRIARASGASLIQVNARDLETLKVDKEACLRLARHQGIQDEEVWIAASGMESRDDLCAAASAGYHAALVGSALMEHGTPGEDLCRLLQGESGI